MRQPALLGLPRVLEYYSTRVVIYSLATALTGVTTTDRTTRRQTDLLTLPVSTRADAANAIRNIAYRTRPHRRHGSASEDQVASVANKQIYLP